jgi:hypothetical protein
MSQVYFDKELYMFWTDLLSIIGSLNTVHTAIGICHASYLYCLLARSGWNSSSILTTQADRMELQFHPDLTSRQSTELAWQIPIAVYSVETPNDGQ